MHIKVTMKLFVLVVMFMYNLDRIDRTIMVSDCIDGGNWQLTDDCRDTLIAAGFRETYLPIPLGGLNICIWKPSLEGLFTVSSAKELIHKKYVKFDGAQLIWRPTMHPSLADRNWKIMRGACATLDKVKVGLKLANKCVMCNVEEESLEHLLWHCSFVQKAWSWLADIFDLQPHSNLVRAYAAAKNSSRMVKDL